MKEHSISRTRLAPLMRTSRAQVNRVLDPNEGNVTIETLQKAAALVGRRVQLELVGVATGDDARGSGAAGVRRVGRSPVIPAAGRIGLSFRRH